MSTRSVLAYPTADGWSGIYCHSDGYPTWTGPQIWHMLHERHHAHVKAFVDAEIKAHPGGWSLMGERCYCHEADPGAGDMLYDWTDEAANGAFGIAWVYVVGTHALTLSTSVRRPGTYREHYDNSRSRYYDAPRYGWALVGQVDLHGAEPNWDKLEQRGHAMQERAARHHGKGAA